MHPPGTTREGEGAGTDGPAVQAGHEPAATGDTPQALASPPEPDPPAASSNAPVTPAGASDGTAEEAPESAGGGRPSDGGRGDEEAGGAAADLAAQSAAVQEVRAQEALSEQPKVEEAPADVPTPCVAIPPVVDVTDLDWRAIRRAVDPAAIRSRMRRIVEGMEALLDQAGGPGLMFDAFREGMDDRAILVRRGGDKGALWFVGDLHGDLLALEAALALVRGVPGEDPQTFVLLGDLFDDGGFGLEVVLRVFELILEAPARICVLAGNHDEALGFDGRSFTSVVDPSDFSDFLNSNAAHEWIERTGKLAIRVFAQAPRALFFPDGLLVAHGGFPLADRHAVLAATGNWNDPGCLQDFVWSRAHPAARHKMPNRFTKGSQFGHRDFAAFCEVAGALGRPVTHMVRGHDHVEERFAVYPAYAHHPILTTVALSRRLDRELFGPHARVPTIARYVEGSLPQVHRLHIPAGVVEEVYPLQMAGEDRVEEARESRPAESGGEKSRP
jgi:hypothetical protein